MRCQDHHPKQLSLCIYRVFHSTTHFWNEQGAQEQWKKLIETRVLFDLVSKLRLLLRFDNPQLLTFVEAAPNDPPRSVLSNIDLEFFKDRKILWHDDCELAYKPRAVISSILYEDKFVADYCDARVALTLKRG